MDVKCHWVHVQSLYAIQAWGCVGSALKKNRNVAEKRVRVGISKVWLKYMDQFYAPKSRRFSETSLFFFLSV